MRSDRGERRPIGAALRLAGILLVAAAGSGPAQPPAEGNELVALSEPCLNLRPEPSLEAAPVRCLPPGRRLTLLESKGDWGRVRLPDAQVGWVVLALVGPAVADPVEEAPPPTAPELESEVERLRAEAAEAERRIQDLEGRLRAAELFLSESEKKRRELAARLAAPEQAPDPEEILATVNGWAESWSQRRVEEHLGFYAESFEPPDGASREAWASERRQSLQAPGRIDVSVALIDLRTPAPDRAEVELLQSHSSEGVSEVVVKTLELVREAGGWKIARETVE